MQRGFPTPLPTAAIDPATGDILDPTSPAEVTPGAPADGWRYNAPANGISNTSTAVQVRAASGADVRNYVSSMQISHNALGGETDFAIRSGAAGTVLWRVKLHTTALPITSIKFDPPLEGDLNTLIEIVTVNNVTGNVMVNLQGFYR